MALIQNTKEHMEFNEDIWREIKSYLKPKKRELFNMLDDKILKLLFNYQNSDLTDKTKLYRMRMVMSKEDINYELSKRGMFERKMFYTQIISRVSFNNVLRDLIRYFKKLNGGNYAVYVSMEGWVYHRYFTGFNMFLDKIRWCGNKRILEQIVICGNQYMERAKRREVNRKRRERVICSGCWKEMSKSSMSRHKKMYCKM